MSGDEIVKFNSIAGVPIRYARKDGTVPPAPPYGTLGTTVRHVSCRADFRDKIAAFLADLARVCPYGMPSALVCGSFMGGRKSGMHAEGRAVDIDAVWWGDPYVTGLDRPKPFPVITYYADQDARRYLAIEATLRRHFGTVLGWWYNAKHKDHWHCDDSSPVGFNPRSTQRALFVQLALTHVLGWPVAVDGKYGPQTETGVASVMGESIYFDLEPIDGWVAFLSAVESAGWR